MIEAEKQEGGKSLKEEISEIKTILSETAKTKSKKFRLPRKAKLSKKRMREGYATVLVLHENRNADFTREPIIDGTIDLKDSKGVTYHATGESEPYYYKGKPLIIQPKNRLNPYDPLKLPNETYGQKYIMARMEGDRIVPKRSIGLLGGSIFALIVLGIIAYAILSG